MILKNSDSMTEVYVVQGRLKMSEIAAKVILTSVSNWFPGTRHPLVDKARRHYVEIREEGARSLECDCAV